MRAIEQTALVAFALMAANMDRFLPPVLIVAALLLAGWMLSYATAYRFGIGM